MHVEVIEHYNNSVRHFDSEDSQELEHELLHAYPFLEHYKHQNLNHLVQLLNMQQAFSAKMK